MSKRIQHSFFYPYPPEVVWEYFTNAELIEQWLMKNDFLPVAGHSFQFWTNPLPTYHFDGTIYCTVLEIVPYTKLSYSWKGGPGDGSFPLDSVVVWTFVATKNGTEVLLDHSGFNNEELAMYSIMNDGWKRNMQKIEGLLKAAAHGTTNS